MYATNFISSIKNNEEQNKKKIFLTESLEQNQKYEQHE